MEKLDSPKQVTHDWIRANFDLKKEAKKKKKSQAARLYEATEGTYEIEEWFQIIRDELERTKKTFSREKIPDDAKEKIAVVEEEDYDYCGCSSMYRTEFHLLFEWEEDETEIETIRRLTSREKQKIKKRKDREAKEAVKEKQRKNLEANEKALLEDLLKKYPQMAR